MKSNAVVGSVFTLLRKAMSEKNTHKLKSAGFPKKVERTVFLKWDRALVLFALVLISIFSSFVLSQELGDGTLPKIEDFDSAFAEGFVESPPEFEPAIPFPGYGFNDENSSFMESSFTVTPDNLQIGSSVNPLATSSRNIQNNSTQSNTTQVSYNYPNQDFGNHFDNTANSSTQSLTVPNFEQNFTDPQVFPPSFPDARLSELSPGLSQPHSAPLPHSVPLPYNATPPLYHAPPPYIPGQNIPGQDNSSLDQSTSLNAPNSPGTLMTFEGVDQSQIILDVRVVGYGQIPLEKLRQKIKTRPNRPYNELQVEEDKRALMQTGWFHNVHPNIYKSQEGITITFELIERPLLHYVKFVGNEKFPKAKLLEISMIAPGDPLDPMYVFQAKSRIEDFYRESGMHKINVEILSGDRPTDRGAVFLISEGRKQRIDRVTFVGCNSLISGARLKTQIQSKPGILYLIGGEFTRAQLDRDVETLTDYYRNLGYFFAKIDRDFSVGRGYFGFGKEDSWVSVRFIIDEGPRCRISRISFSGNRVFTNEQILAEMKKTKAGEYFNQGGLALDMRKIKEMYGKKGRVFTEVEYDYVVDAPNPNEGIIELAISIRESHPFRFEEVTVDILDANGGNASYTKVATVLNRTPKIRAGRLVDTKEIGDAERRLRYSMIFNSNPAQGYVPELIFELDDDKRELVFEDAMTASGDSGITRGQNARERYVEGRFSNVPQPAIQNQVPANNIPARNEPVPRGNMKPNKNSNRNPDNAEAIRAMIQKEVKDVDSRLEQSTRRDEKVIQEKQLQRKQEQRNQQQEEQQQEERPMIILGQSRSVPAMPTSTTSSGVYSNSSGSYVNQNIDVSANVYSNGTTQAVQPFVAPREYERYGSVPQYDTMQYDTPQNATSQYAAATDTTSGSVTPFNPNAVSDGSNQYSNPYSSDNYGNNYYGNNNNGNNNSNNISTVGFLQAPQPYIPGPHNPSTQGGGIIDPVMPGSAELQDINNVFFNPKPSPIMTVPARFRVMETQTGQFRASVGVNSDSGLIANFLYKEDNFDWRRPPKNPLRFEDWRDAFRGAGERFKIDLSPGTDYQRYEVAWENPHFMNTDWSLGLSGFYYSRYYSEWRERRIGGTVSLGYRLTEDMMLSVSYKGESARIYDPISIGIPDLDKALGTNALHTFGLRLAHDTRDNPHLATEGHLITFSAEQIVGSFQYPRLSYDARQYFMLHERPDTSGRWVLGFRSAASWSDNDTPIFERFYAGGFTTLRGFDYRGVSPRFEGWMPIGGNFELYNSAELLFPITADDMIRGVVFVDTGCVQPKIDDWAQKYRVAPGFGVRITIPFMGPTPIAFDFAFPISKDPTDVKNVFTFYVGFMR